MKDLKRAFNQYKKLGSMMILKKFVATVRKMSNETKEEKLLQLKLNFL